jgi:hypothetical protein
LTDFESRNLACVGHSGANDLLEKRSSTARNELEFVEGILHRQTSYQIGDWTCFPPCHRGEAVDSPELW